MIRLIRLCTLLLVLLGTVSLLSAKGMTNHIIITAPDGEETIVRDLWLAGLLSMGQFEDFNAEIESPPDDLPEPYILQRQWDNGKSIRPMDVIEFYPPKGDASKGDAPEEGALNSGIVKYRGLVNGNTGYDGKYYQVQAEGLKAFDFVMNSAGRVPYVLLTNDAGELHVYNTDLTPVSQAKLHDSGLIYNIQANYDGAYLFYTVHGGQEPTSSDSRSHFSLDTNEMILCPGKPIHLYLDTLSGREFVHVGERKTISITNIFKQIEYGEYENENGTVFRWGLTEFPLTSASTSLYPDESRSLIYAVDVQEGHLHVSSFELSFQSANSTLIEDDPAIGHYDAVWSSDFVGEFYITNGRMLYEFPHFFGTGEYRSHALEWDGREAVEDEQGVALLAGAREHKAYLYIPFSGDMTLDEQAYGIFEINASTGKQINHLLPDTRIMDAILLEETLFVVGQAADSKTPHLMTLSLQDGEIVQTREILPAHDWHLTALRTQPDAFSALERVKRCG